MASSFSRSAGAIVAILLASAAGAAEVPLAGCYERVYDAAHLSAHKGQLVVRAAITIEATKIGEQTDKDNPFVADGSLKIWVRGKKQSFDSIGACRADGGSLICEGSLSAAEAETCKSERDGVRQCRNESGPGSFKVEGKPDGVLVSIREQLEQIGRAHV